MEKKPNNLLDDNNREYVVALVKSLGGIEKRLDELKEKKETETSEETLKAFNETIQKSIISVKGEKGDKGERGEKGIDGKNADEDAILSKLIKQIPAPIKGDTGKQGEKGDTPIIDVKQIVSDVILALPNTTLETIKSVVDKIKNDKVLSVEDLSDFPDIVSLIRKYTAHLENTGTTIVGSGANALLSLLDVDRSSIGVGKVPTWNGERFIFQTPSGGGSSITLKTDDVNNGSQSILNLKAGTNLTLTDDGLGGVTIDAIGDGMGDVTGAISSVNNNVVLFNGTTGKVIKDSGKSLSAYFEKSVDTTDNITVGATNKFATTSEKTKLTNISITQPVDLDTLESDTATNNAKVTNATHTGDATGSTTLTLATVNSNVGSFGLAGSVSQFVVNAKGLITSAVNVVISVTASQVLDFAATVRATVLTGISFATSTAVTATDSILVAIGKLQAQNTAQDTAISSKVQSITAGTNITVTGTATNPIINSTGGGATNLAYTPSATDGIVTSDTGTDATIPLGNGTNAGLSLNDYTTTQKSKLAGIAAGATVNSTDAQLKDRSIHTGTQLSNTISDFDSAARAQVEAELIAGTNVTITPAGTGSTRTLTIAAIGAGGVVAPVASRIYRNTNQAIPTGAGWTDLSWSTSAYQANGTFWTSGATTTIPENGYYQIFAEATFDGTGLLGSAIANLQILVNGTNVIGDDEKQVIINGKAALFAMAQRLFTAGDTIKIQVKHNDTGSVNVLAQGDHSPDIIITKLTGAKGDPGIGGAVTTSAEIDFGTKPTKSKRFTITDAAVSPTSKIMAWGNSSPATGRVGNDWEWDSINFTALASTGTFTLTGLASGRIIGKRKIFYSIN